MVADRPDWLWNKDAGIDRTYSATNMVDAAEALDEVRAYITKLEDYINAPRCDCGHFKSDHDFSDSDFNTPCLPRTRCGCNNYVPLRPEKETLP